MLLHFFVIRQQVSEANWVVGFQLVGCEISALGELGKHLHAETLGVLVQLRLSLFVLLHRDEVFPLLTANLTVPFFFVKEAAGHQLSPFRGPVNRSFPWSLSFEIVVDINLDIVRARVWSPPYVIIWAFDLYILLCLRCAQGYSRNLSFRLLAASFIFLFRGHYSLFFTEFFN